MSWLGSPDGRFSVQSSYKLLFELAYGVDGVLEGLWGSSLHEQLKVFCWRILSKILPTRKAVFDRMGHCDRGGVFYGCESETVNICS